MVWSLSLFLFTNFPYASATELTNSKNWILFCSQSKYWYEWYLCWPERDAMMLSSVNINWHVQLSDTASERIWSFISICLDHICTLTIVILWNTCHSWGTSINIVRSVIRKTWQIWSIVLPLKLFIGLLYMTGP